MYVNETKTPVMYVTSNKSGNHMLLSKRVICQTHRRKFIADTNLLLQKTTTVQILHYTVRRHIPFVSLRICQIPKCLE
jgi:hypothetical protein